MENQLTSSLGTITLSEDIDINDADEIEFAILNTFYTLNKQRNPFSISDIALRSGKVENPPGFTNYSLVIKAREEQINVIGEIKILITTFDNSGKIEFNNLTFIIKVKGN